MLSPSPRQLVARLQDDLRGTASLDGPLENLLLSVLLVGLAGEVEGAADSSLTAGLSPDELQQLRAARKDLVHGVHAEHRGIKEAIASVAKAFTRGQDPASLRPEEWLEGLHDGRSMLSAEAADLVVRLAEIDRASTVYAPWDMSGQLAVRAARQASEVVVETPLPSLHLLVAKLLTGSAFRVARGDPIYDPQLSSDAGLQQFDLAIAVPPMGISYSDAKSADRYGRFPERSASSTILAIRHLLRQAERRVVVIVPTSFLSASGAEERLRQDLIEQQLVEAVVALPLNLTGPATPMAVLLLSPKGGARTIRFVDASRGEFHEELARSRNRLTNLDALVRLTLGGGEGTGAEGLCKTAPIEDVQALNHSLQVRRYVASEASSRAARALSAGRAVRLCDVVHHVAPLPNSLRTAPHNGSQSKLWEVTTHDIPDRGFISSVSKSILVPEDGNFRHLLLKPLDVVVVTKGAAVGKVGILSGEPFATVGEGVVVGQSAVVLRVAGNEMLEPRALCLLLRSSLGKQWLDSLVAGTTTPLIQIRELLAMQVVLPSASEQRKASDVLEREQSIQKEIDRLRHEQVRLAADLWTLQ